jgi:hypothetical protein
MAGSVHVTRLSPSLLGEVDEVLGVERSQRQGTDQAAGGDPAVLDRVVADAQLRIACRSPQRRATCVLSWRRSAPAEEPWRLARLPGLEWRMIVTLSSPVVTNVTAETWPRGCRVGVYGCSRVRTSSSEGRRSRAATASGRCWDLVAPTIRAATTGFLSTQARATCAMGTRWFSATGCTTWAMGYIPSSLARAGHGRDARRSLGTLVEGDDCSPAEPDVVLQGQARTVDLARTSLAPQLPDQLAALCQAGGPERVALGEQAA